LSSFWLILKQQWTIEEISIFSNSSHLEWRAGLSDTRTIPARFGLIRFRGFRGDDLNVKVYDVRRTDGWTDAKWWQKLTWSLLARWTKKAKVLGKQIHFLWSYIYDDKSNEWSHARDLNYKITQYFHLSSCLFSKRIYFALET
jgi:hypothetical protein